MSIAVAAACSVPFAAASPASAASNPCGSTGVLQQNVPHSGSYGWGLGDPPPPNSIFGPRCEYSTVGTDTFTVPHYTKLVDIEALAPGPVCAENIPKLCPPFGYGGLSAGLFSLTPGQQLQINVGGAPETKPGVSAFLNTDPIFNQYIGGFNGGGNGGSAGSMRGSVSGNGGAGASDVRIAPFGLPHRIVVAGGGGGSYRESDSPGTPGFGGEGGGETAGDGLDGPGSGAVAGGDGGQGGNQQGGGASPGVGADSSGFGFGGQGGPGSSSIDGHTEAFGGSGGGGGWYGGGATGTTLGLSRPGGGGGGSGYVAPGAASPQNQKGFNNLGLPAHVYVDFLDPPTPTATVTITNTTGGKKIKTVVTLPNGLAPQGTIILTDNGLNNGSAFGSQGALEPDDNGVMTYTKTTSNTNFTVGHHDIVANYQDFYGELQSVNSAAAGFDISPSDLPTPTISFTSVAPANAQAFGPTYNVAATASSGLPVSFSIDLASAGVCTLSGSTVSFTGAGTCKINADQAGDATHLAATRNSQSFAVAGTTGTQAITFTSTPPVNPNTSTSYIVTATGGASGNPVTFSAPGSDPCVAISFTDGTSRGLVNFSNVGGTCHVIANQAAGNGYTAAPAVQQLITVPPTPRSYTFSTTPPSPALVGGQYTIRAKLSPGGGWTFTFRPAASSTGCTVGSTTNEGSATASAVVTFTAPGTCVVTPVRDIDDTPQYAAPEPAQQSIVVTSPTQPQTITFAQPGPFTYGDAPQTLTASAPAGAVTFAVTSGPCEIASGKLKINGAGSCDVKASQPGGNGYDAAAPVTRSVTVNKASSNTVTTSSRNPAAAGTPVTLTATVSAPGTASGSVTFNDGGVAIAACTAIAVGANCTVAFTGSGSHAISAVYSGDTNVTGSSGNLTQTINPPPACQPVSAQTGRGVAVAVQLSCADAAGAALTYSIAGAPAHGALTTVSPAGQVTYTPAGGYIGTDSFTYKASSANGTSAPQTVSVSVAAPPTASITAPAVSAAYGLGQTVAAAYGCAAGAYGGVLKPGSAGCSGNVAAGAPIDTSTPGAKSFTVTATDVFGNTGTATVNYTVTKGASTTTLTSSASPSQAGQSVEYTATIKPVAPATGVPTGTVAFTDGTTAISGCTAVAVTSAGTASCTVTYTATGSHPIKAVYSGDTRLTTSNGTLAQVVDKAATKLTINPTTPRTVASVTFTVTLTRVFDNAPLAGRVVNFVSGGRTLCSATTTSAGQARCTAVGLFLGAVNYTSTYAGDATTAASSVSGTL